MCFILLTCMIIRDKSFPCNQYHGINFLPQKLSNSSKNNSNFSRFFSNFSRFFFQFFKLVNPIYAQSPVRGHKYALDQSLLSHISTISQPYLIYISSIHISGISQAYLRYISPMPQAYLRHTSGISRAYLRHILEVSCAYLR